MYSKFWEECVAPFVWCPHGWHLTLWLSPIWVISKSGRFLFIVMRRILKGKGQRPFWIPLFLQCITRIIISWSDCHTYVYSSIFLFCFYFLHLCCPKWCFCSLLLKSNVLFRDKTCCTDTVVVLSEKRGKKIQLFLGNRRQ